MYKKLVQGAEKILNEGSNFLYGIEACNEVLDGKGPEIGDALRHECLCIRAALLLKVRYVLVSLNCKRLILFEYMEHRHLNFRGNGRMMFTWL